MSGLLKDTLSERAAAEEAPHLDLATIARVGDRRIRRRRRLTGVTAVAAVIAVVTAGTVAFDRDAAEGPAGGPDSFARRSVTWASGDTIHYGDRTIRVSPVSIKAFVQTDSGFVLTDASGAVYVADGRSVTRIGAGNRSLRLSADDTGSWAGWVDHTAAVPEFVVYDVASRRELLRTAEGNKAAMEPWPSPNAPTAVDIDGRYAYFAAADGLHRWEVATGRGTLLERGLRGQAVLDVAAGKFAVGRPTGSESDIVVSDDLGADEPRFDGWTGTLSPGGSHLATDRADVQRVFSVEQGTIQQVSHPEHPIYAPTQWLDETRFVALGIRDKENKPVMQPIDLLVCTVGSRCEVAVPAFASYPRDGNDPGFQVPNGQSIPAY